jgi:DNA-binding NarL/FixJ family response regulator
MIRIAIVEDNPPLLNNLLERLQNFPEIQVVFTAFNGKNYLEKMEMTIFIEQPEVVLMDIEMDIMNGIEATKKSKERFFQTEIVMLTVFNDDEKVFEAIKAGASGYLLKDEKIERIIEALEEVQAGGSLMSPSIAKKTLQFLKSGQIPEKQKNNNLNNNEFRITEREMQILGLIIQGISYPDIGTELGISYGTVRTHVKNIFEKLQVKNKKEATKLAINKKWFSW